MNKFSLKKNFLGLVVFDLEEFEIIHRRRSSENSIFSN